MGGTDLPALSFPEPPERPHKHGGGRGGNGKTPNCAASVGGRGGKTNVFGLQMARKGALIYRTVWRGTPPRAASKRAASMEQRRFFTSKSTTLLQTNEALKILAPF